MRILILTHPRSGGFNLLAWISKELGSESYHEPLLNPDHVSDQRSALTSPDCVVKEDISHVIDLGLNVGKFIGAFDLVILHIREDRRDTAISWVRQIESGESHKVYEIDDEWIRAREWKIREIETMLMGLQGTILWHGANPVRPCLKTSYEGIYHSGQDIPALCQFLGISEPRWTDLLSPGRRLRNGNHSLSEFL